MSAVAGILDRKGGLRVIVTQRWRMRYHVGKGERLFVIPGLDVKEPVAWNDIPPLIDRVQKYVVKTIAPVNHCGECNLCCILPFIQINEVAKQPGIVCPNCSLKFGCKIYNSRPPVCRNFKCLWLQSQSRNDKMPIELRPDKCGVYFTGDTTTDDPLIIEVHGEPNGDAWQWIDEMQKVGFKARKIAAYLNERKQ